MKKIIYIVLGAVLLCGCEYNFELDETKENDKLYVLCIAGDEDETFINIQRAIPANRDDSSKPVKTNVSKLDLKVNGKSVSLSKYDVDNYRYNLWRTTDPILPGDELSLEVEADGTDPIKAVSVVPGIPVIKSITVSPSPDKESGKVVFNVALDNVREGSYYAFDCTTRMVEITKNIDSDIEIRRDTTYYNEWVMPAVEYDEISDDSEAPWIETNYNGISFDTYDGVNLMVLDSKTLVGNGGSFEFAIYANEDNEREDGGWYYYDQEANDWLIAEGDPNIRHYSYYTSNITVYQLSNEAFRYIKARYIENYNVLASIGLAPASFTYSNIDGGFGVLAGLAKTDTGYFKASK